jgi:hypothetical protein
MNHPWIIHFALGGTIVSLFTVVTVVGVVLTPTTLDRLFASAPSVAVASLAPAIANQGPKYVVAEATTMCIGSMGLLAYAALGDVIARRDLSSSCGARFSCAQSRLQHPR